MAMFHIVSVNVKTVFDYTPAAVDKLFNAYKRKFQLSNLVECRFDSKEQQFQLEGDVKYMENAIVDFMDVLQKMTVEESRKPKQELIIRTKSSELNAAIRWTLDPPDQPSMKGREWGLKQVSSNDPKFEQPGSEVDYMFDYCMTEYWEPEVTQKEFTDLLSLEANPSIPEQLMRLFDCAIFPDWNKRSVKIGSNDRMTLDLIFRKLQSVEDFFRRGFTPLVVNLVNAENKPRFRLRFVSLSKQSITERTTLFDSHSKWNTHPTEKLFTVRLMEYDANTQKHKACKLENGLVHTAYKTPGHTDWMHYSFCLRRGANPVVIPEMAESARFGRRIEREDMICVYHPPAESAPIISEALSTMDPAESGTSIGAEQARRHPRAKPSMDNGNVNLKTASLSTPTQSPLSPGKESSEDIIDFPIKRNYPFRPQPARSIFDVGPRPSVPLSDDCSTVSGGIYLGSEPDRSTGIVMQARPTGAEESPADSGAIRRPRERKPAQAPGHAARPVETAERTPEPNTRRVMRTTNQKQPRSEASFISNQNEAKNLRRYNAQKVFESFFPALEYARGWYGDLKLEAKAGRVIFADIDRDIAKKDLEWDQWYRLVDEIAPRTAFTRLITTQHFDMEYLRDLKLAGGENVFSSEPVGRKVTYDFDIEQKGKKFVLSIDGETFEPILYASKKTFGAVNMSNPVHAWDYRIDLVGKKRLDLKSYPYIKSIYDGLSCAEGPELTFPVIGPALLVKRVILTCETRYTVYLDTLRLGVPMELVMAEVQELQICKSHGELGTYRAVSLPKNVMLRQSKLHWVCSIVPTQTNALLQKNTEMEVGEIAEWSADSILEPNLLAGLQSVMNMVIAKMDYVGSTNDAFVDVTQCGPSDLY